MEHQLQNNSQLLKTLFQNNLYEKAIQEANRKYKIKHYRIEKLKPSGIKNLLKKSSKRQKNLNIEENNYAWAEGQLKIFVWVLVGYVYFKKIDICDMTQKDFDFFTQFFDGYSTHFLNYQAKFLLRSSQKITWSQYEAKLLNEIIKAKFQQKNWNTVAYQLYLNSDKTVFRTPKQCRQRWLNHEDPSKNHSEWTIQQDIELLRFVKCSGKKWSMISKSMKSTRTEHMVKNRFTSLIKKASKTLKSNCERDILDNLLKLKKAERDRKLTESLNQSSVSDQKTQEPVEQQIEIEEIQHPIQIENCNNENEKQIQYFGPCNLIPELQPENHPGPGSLETDELIDFFEKDNTYPTQKFLDLFF